MTGGWYDEGESGPPTMEDDAWYTHAVVSLDYPSNRRYMDRMRQARENGQLSIEDLVTEGGVYAPIPPKYE
jgi:hypothetical protein